MKKFTDKKESVFRRVIKGAAVAVFWLAAWQLAAVKAGQELILPGPRVVFTTLLSLSQTGEFWLTALLSLIRIFSGFAVGAAAGSVLALLTSQSRLLDALFSPIVKIVRATPVASFIILALLWIGKARVPGFTAALMVLPVVWGSVSSALKETDPLLLEMAHVYRFGALKTLRLVYIPSVLPAWRSACITALGLAWKAGVAAEVLCQPKNSLGSELYYSKIYLETPSLFAWTAVVVILSFIFEGVLVRILGRRTGR